MFTIDVNLKGKILEGRAGPELNRRLKGTLLKTGREVQSRVKKHVPVGVSGEAKDGVDLDLQALKLTATIYEKGPGTRYIEVLEKGRGMDKKAPPPAEIRRWLELTDKGKAFVKIIKKKYFDEPAAAAKAKKKTAKNKNTAQKTLTTEEKKRKKIDRDKRILDAATFIKCRAIGRQGTKPLKMFKTAYEERKDWVIRQFHDTVRDFVRTP